MPVQAELVRTVARSARLSKDQGPLNREALSPLSVTRVKSAAPVCAGHTSPLLCLTLHCAALTASCQENPQGCPGGTEISRFPCSNMEQIRRDLCSGAASHHGGCTHSCSQEGARWVGLAPVRVSTQCFHKTYFAASLSLEIHTETLTC